VPHMCSTSSYTGGNRSDSCEMTLLLTSFMQCIIHMHVESRVLASRTSPNSDSCALMQGSSSAPLRREGACACTNQHKAVVVARSATSVSTAAPGVCTASMNHAFDGHTALCATRCACECHRRGEAHA
jgi:hypothetical protein